MSNSSWGWEQRSRAGWIYILRFSSGLCKIGRTIHLATRLKVHQREYKDPGADFIAVKRVQDCLHSERKWHQKFSDRRRGLAEHFELTEEDIDKFDRSNY